MIKEKRPLKNVFFLAAVIFLIILFVCCYAGHGFTLCISDQVTEKIYKKIKVKSGDTLTFKWEHSFEHIPWNEYYKIEKNKTFTLFTVSVGGFGAGIPAEMDCTYRYADGMIYMENIKGSIFTKFDWINSKTQLKDIRINDDSVITGKDLPEHGRIELKIK